MSDRNSNDQSSTAPVQGVREAKTTLNWPGTKGNPIVLYEEAQDEKVKVKLKHSQVAASPSPDLSNPCDELQAATNTLASLDPAAIRGEAVDNLICSVEAHVSRRQGRAFFEGFVGQRRCRCHRR